LPTIIFPEEDMTPSEFPTTPDASKRRSMMMAAGLVAATALPQAPAWAQSKARTVSAADWAKIKEAARKEGKVIVYGTMGPAQHERIVAAFNAANPGIKMELVRVVGAALTAKVEQERQQPNVVGADLVLTADIRWAGDAVKKGYLKTPVGPAAAAYPDAWLRGGQVALMAHTPWVMHYNTNLVKTPITSYQDLLRPELAGKVGGVSLVAEVVTLFYKWLDESNPGYLEKFAAQKVKMYPSTVASANSTASGEISAGVFSVIPVDNALHAQKAPMKTVIPAQAYGFAYGSAVLGWSKNPNAAMVAQDFIMSVQGQSAVVGNAEAASPLPNVPGALDVSKINLTLIDWDKVTAEGVKTFEARWNSLFGAR
jgi:iron(III) transport system substrate-binding protein